jgi:competence protein ComEC
MKYEFAGRPLLGMFGCLVVGLTASHFPLNLLLLAIPLWLYRDLTVRLMLAFAFVLGAVLAPRPAPVLDQPRSFEGVGTVEGPTSLKADATMFTLRTDQGAFSAAVKDAPALPSGTELQVSGMLKPPTQGSEQYQAMRGISGRLTVKSWEVVQEAPLVMRWADAWRRSFVDFAAGALPKREAGLLSAICFNTQSLVDDQTMDEMQRTGTIHIVSVSGLHVVILAGALLGVLTVLPMPRAGQLGILAAVLGFYGAATGFNAPIVRAIFMIMAAYAAYLFGRESDVLSSLAFAGIAYLLYRPNEVFSAGFQLSFLTVAGFALFLSRPRSDASSPMGFARAKVEEVLKASFAASVLSAPLVGYYFGLVSVVGVVANLFVAAVIVPILVISLGGHLLSLVIPAGQMLTGGLVYAQLGWLELVWDVMSQGPVVPIPEFNGYLLLPIYGALLLMGRTLVRQP